MRQCGKCKKNLPFAEFYIRKTGERAGKYYEKCKKCFLLRGRDYYHKNQSRQLELAKLRKQKYIKARMEFLAELKNKGCIDCGKIYPPYVMDFDHRDGTIKISSISNLAIHKTSNLEKIKAEIAKCDLVCANCHRIRTYDRLHKQTVAAVAKMVKADA